MVTLIIPTLRHDHLDDCLATLKFIPFPFKLITVDTGNSWAEAINIGLAQSDPDDDVILMDDDVLLHEDTFADLPESLRVADLIGFKLLFPDGTIQHAGGVLTKQGMGHLLHGQPDQPIKRQYVCHATTSLIYIKRYVLNNIGDMAINQSGGQQFEDVDFCWRALKAGYCITVHPGSATHHCSKTKGKDPQFQAKMELAMEEVFDRHLTVDFMELLQGYPHAIQSF